MTVATASVAILCTLISLVVVTRSRHPRAHAVALILGFSTFVPMVSAPSELVLAFLLAAAAIGVAAKGRSLGKPNSSRAPFASLAIFFILYMHIVRVSGNQAPLQEWALAGVAVITVVLATKLQRDDLFPIARTLSVFLIIHLLYAVGELWAGLPPIWPMGNGLTDMIHRPNFLFPGLAGRPMTSFAHPIPLATFAVMVGLLLGYLAFQTSRKVYWIGTFAAAALVLLSGTRSAVIAMAVAFGVMLISSRRVGQAFKVKMILLVATIGALLVVYPSALSVIGLGSGFKDTLSYQYRMSVLGSAWQIVQQPPLNVIFGWGANREEVFRRGIVDGAEYGVLFFDNQFVAMAALFGLVGLGLFLATFLAVVFKGGGLSKAMVASFAIMAFGFDYLQYLTPALFFYFAISMGAISLRGPAISGVLSQDAPPAAVVSRPG